MKKFFLIIAVLVLSSPSYAQVPAYQWSGCYIGANAGGGWTKSKWTNTEDASVFGDLVPGDFFNSLDSGFVGGGQLGCNVQSGQFVFGVEGSFEGASIKASGGPLGAGDDRFTLKYNTIGTAVAKLGWSTGNQLWYVKGGYGGADLTLRVIDDVGGPGSNADNSQKRWHNGWALGGGVDFALGNNWAFGIDYTYINLNTKSHELGDTIGNYTFDVDPKIQTLLARFSYKFGSSGY